MCVSQGVFMVLSNGLVEVLVLFLRDLTFFSEPKCFHLVDGLPLPYLLSHSLGLLLLFFLLFIVLSFVCDLTIFIFFRFLLFAFCSSFFFFIFHLFSHFL
mmetsp:Transcript_9725/g.9436  ORF Transcript_9725/g.9436 Transcript_9725/m.9436 type:complete len:100 (+) Transcript_9725:1585-1884(+)